MQLTVSKSSLEKQGLPISDPPFTLKNINILLSGSFNQQSEFNFDPGEFPAYLSPLISRGLELVNADIEIDEIEFRKFLYNFLRLLLYSSSEYKINDFEDHERRGNRLLCSYYYSSMFVSEDGTLTFFPKNGLESSPGIISSYKKFFREGVPPKILIGRQIFSLPDIPSTTLNLSSLDDSKYFSFFASLAELLEEHASSVSEYQRSADAVTYADIFLSDRRPTNYNMNEFSFIPSERSKILSKLLGGKDFDLSFIPLWNNENEVAMLGVGKLVKVFFFDDITQDGDWFRLATTLRRMKEWSKYYAVLPIPLSKATFFIENGIKLSSLPHLSEVLAKRRNDLNYKEVVKKLQEAGALQHTEIEEYLSNKIKIKELFDQEELPTPSWNLLDKDIAISDIEQIMENGDGTVYFKNSEQNNGVGIGRIIRKNGRYILILSGKTEQDLSKLEEYPLDDTDVYNQIKDIYSKKGYDIENFSDRYLIESGISKYQLGEEKIEFRLSILPDGYWEITGRVLPKDDFRSNTLIGGKVVLQPDVEQKFKDIGKEKEYTALRDSMQKLVDQIKGSKVGNMVNDVFGYSFDVVIGNDLQPYILEMQPIGSVSESFLDHKIEMEEQIYRDKILSEYGI